MPTYTFLNTETNEEFDQILRMKDLDSYKEKNPYLKQIIRKQQPIIRSRDMKPDNGFRDLLKTIKKGSPKSTVNTF